MLNLSARGGANFALILRKLTSIDAFVNAVWGGDRFSFKESNAFGFSVTGLDKNA